MALDMNNFSCDMTEKQAIRRYFVPSSTTSASSAKSRIRPGAVRNTKTVTGTASARQTV